MNFNYNENSKKFEATLQMLNKNVRVVVRDESDIEVANKIIDELDIDSLINFIVKEYYDKNDNTWFGSEVSKEDFINSIYLKTIVFRNGRISYWFDAGDLYGGHDVLVERKYDSEELSIDLA